MLRASMVTACALIVFALFAVGAHFHEVHPQASATVKLFTANGHGSGVHIGKGFILTAAHVIKADAEYRIKTDLGTEQSVTVLWTNKEYDVALVRVAEYSNFKSAELSCTDPELGTSVHAVGNPGDVEFVTLRGYVIGRPRAVSDVKSVLVVDMTTVPGMSGGPVLDSYGRVVGLVSMVMVVPMGFSASLVGIGYAVPGSTVCSLMARS